MTSSEPTKGPEHHTSTLSPVSPKPLHIPSPANIPILENQMDSALDDDSPMTLEPARDAADSEASAPAPDVGEANHIGVEAEDMIQDVHGQSSEAATEDVNGAQQQHPIEPQTAFPSVEAAFQDPAHLHQGALDHGVLPSQASQPIPTPSADAPMPSAPLLGGFNIQDLLDNISASASSSTAPQGDSLTRQPSIIANQDTLHTAPAPFPHAEIDQQMAASAAADESTTPHHPHLAANQSAFAPENNGSVQAANETQQTGPSFFLPVEQQLNQALDTNTSQPIQGTTSGASFGKSTPHPHNIDAKDGENVPWDKETQRKYDAFLDDERQHVLEGRWDRFPNGSRLFIGLPQPRRRRKRTRLTAAPGNLSSEKVTKRDLFHVFHRYGKLAQISIKQAYGFVQFLLAEDCARALHNEQGVSIRGRKVHLEISKRQNPKPPGEKKDEGGRQARSRRSRSPERTRTRRGGRGRQQDNYRPSRSPSPPRARATGDQYRSRRSPDRYDGRRRSRSPSTRDGRGSPSASGMDDDLPIRRRAAHQVPDLQILVKDLRDRDTFFVDVIKAAFVQRGIRVQDLNTHGLNEAAILRRQIFEGVLAVLRLDPDVQRSQRYHLSIFARTAGASTVRFEEYRDMDINVCVELVVRAKQQAQQPDYGLARFGLPSAPPPMSQQQYPAAPSPGGFGIGHSSPMPGALTPGPAGGLDPAALQRLLQGTQNLQNGAKPLQGHLPLQPPTPLSPMGNGHGVRPPGPFGQSQQGVPYTQPPGAGGPTFGATSDVSKNMPAGATSSMNSATNGTDIQSIIAQLGQYRQ